MALQEYILTITSKGANARFKIRYKAGRFNRIEHLSGNLANQQQHEALMKLCPQLEKAILILQMEWKDRGISWEKLEKAASGSLFSWFIAEYSTWYEANTKLKPRITGAEGKSLKSIIQHLNSVCETEQEAQETWSAIFKKWNDLSPFHQSQTELRHINSNLNIILRQIGNVSKAESLDDKFKALLKA